MKISLVVCVGHRSGTDWLEVINIAVGSCGSPNESYSEDGLANISVCAKDLVYPEILEEQRHATESKCQQRCRK